MRPISILTATSIAILAALPGTAFSAEKRAFDQAAFQAAQAQGRSIVVDISAPWCPTCRAQAPIIESLAQDPSFSDTVIFQVDFDGQNRLEFHGANGQKDAVRALGARMQSTIIGYDGSRETGRSVGDTNSASIEALFRSTLGGRS